MYLTYGEERSFWCEAYIAAIRAGEGAARAVLFADQAIEEFRKRT